MKVTDKEIQSVVKLTAFDRYEYFIKRVADSEKMYSLTHPDGEWALAETEGEKLFSLWSDKEYAILNTAGGWEGCTVKEITIEFFQNELQKLIEKEGFLLNVFPLNDMTGFVLDIDEFDRDLKEELLKYE